ncbi:uncharacterized protein LOC100377157 [Saccoglossus kowalevskii]
MMSTAGTTRANNRGSNAREKQASKSSTHNTNKTTTPNSKQTVQPTADQVRMAQITQNVDPETMAKIQQVRDVTGKSVDEAVVALHDHDDDPAKAITYLLENEDLNEGEWETTSRKKKGRNQPQTSRNIETISTPIKEKDNRDKDKDRDKGNREKENRDRERDGFREGGSNRGRGRGRDGPPPRMRGRGRENGSVSERNERNRQNGEYSGRGRGSRDREDRWNRDDRPGGRYGHMNGPLRRGRGGGPRMGTFNSESYNKGSREFVNSKLEESNVWTNPTETTTSTTLNTQAETGTWGDSITATTEDWSAEGDWGGDLAESKVFTARIGSPPPSKTLPDSTTSSLSNSIHKPAEPTGQSSADGMNSGRQTSHILGQLTDVTNQSVPEPTPAQVGIPSQPSSLGVTATVGAPVVTIGSVTIGRSVAVGTAPVGTTSSLGTVGSMPVVQQSAPPSQHLGQPPVTGPVTQPSSAIVQPPPPRTQQPKIPKSKKMPPPSKIPATPVEMPMSAYTSSLGNVDVQFGALDVTDFISNNDSVATCTGSSLLSSSTVSSVNDVSSGTSHLSTFSSKPNDTYGGSLMSSSMMSSASVTMTTTSAPIASSLEQSARTTYSQSASSQSKSLQPDHISLPQQTSSLMGSSQRASQSTTMDVGSVNMSSNAPSSLAQSMATSHPGPSLPTSHTTSGSSSTLPPLSHSSNLPSSGSNLSTLVSHHSNHSPSAHTGLGSVNHTSTFAATTHTSSHTGSNLSGAVSGSSHSTHTSVQTSPMAPGKLSGLSNVKDNSLDGSHHVHQSVTQSSLGSSGLGSVPHSVSSLTTTGTVPLNIQSATSVNVSSALGFSSTTTTALSSKATTQTTSSKAALNLPPGMPLLNQMAGHQFIMTPGILPYHQPISYNYDELQLLQRMPMGYPSAYDMPQFQPNTALTTGRDGASLGNVQYSVTEATKFSRNDASSPIVSSVSSQQQQQQPQQQQQQQQQQPQQQQQQPGQGGHHQQQQQQQQQFINPAIPPGYGYGGMAYYPTGAAGVVPGLQYGAHTMFSTVNAVPPSTRSQGSSAPHSGFQQPTAYGQHGSHGGYGTGQLSAFTRVFFVSAY